MSDKPSIESLRSAISRIETPEDQYALYRATDELESLRAENEAMKASAYDARVQHEAVEVSLNSQLDAIAKNRDAALSELESLRAENEALKEENRFALRAGHEFKAERDSAIRQAKAVGDALMAVSAERDAERSRSDALAARVEIWRAFLNSTPVADLSARDARIRREEREAAAVKVDELAALVRLLVHSIRKHSPDNETARRAMDYLKRHELQGSPLRGLSPAPDAAKPNNQQDQP